MKAVLNGIFAASFGLLIACSDSNQKTDNPGQSKRVIAVMLAENGPADFIGKPEKQVMEKLIEQAESGPGLPDGVEIQFIDTGSNPRRAVEQYEAIRGNADLIAIIGPSTSGESLKVAKLAEEDEVPLLSLAASKNIVLNPNDLSSVKKWVFKFAQNDDLAAKRVASAIEDKFSSSLVKVGLLYSDDAFGGSGEDVFSKEASTRATIDLKFTQPFPPTMARADVVVKSIPKELDALVIWGTSPGPAIITRELAIKRPDLKLFFSHGNASQSFIDNTRSASDGATVIGSHVLRSQASLDLTDDFDKSIEKYQKFWRSSFSGAPNHFGGHAYDALSISIKILSDPDIDTRVEFRNALEGQQIYNGVTGIFSFSPDDHAGLKATAFAVYEIKDGEFSVVESK